MEDDGGQKSDEKSVIHGFSWGGSFSMKNTVKKCSIIAFSQQ
jgi:hypothetical protein